MAHSYISTNFATPSGKLIKIKDLTGKVRYTIRPETITSSYVEDVFIKIKTASDNRIISLEFETNQSAKAGLTSLKSAIKIALDNSSNQPGNAGILGLPTDGSYAGESGIDAGITVEDAFDRLEDLVLDLIVRPDLVSGVTWSGITWSGLEAGSGDFYENLQPSLNISTSPFRSSGTVELYINSVLSGLLSSPGTNGGLTLTLGQSGPWTAYLAQVQSIITGTTVVEVTQLGVSTETTVRIDSDYIPSLSAHPSLDYIIATGSSWISGIPVLKAGDLISFNATLNGIIGDYYNPVPLKISGMSYLEWTPSVTTPNTAPIVEESLFITTGVTGDISLTIDLFNVFNTNTTQTIIRTPMWVDTLSDETGRVQAGSGLYPLVWGDSWNPMVDLNLTEELMLSEGMWQWPSGNWTSNYPVSGYDYTLVTGDTRWVLFNMGTFSGKGVEFKLTNCNVDMSQEELIPTGITIQVCLSGITGWLSASSAYPGWGNPLNDGDPALVADTSSYDGVDLIRSVTFGDTFKEGQLFIRVGIDRNSGITFKGVVIC